MLPRFLQTIGKCLRRWLARHPYARAIVTGDIQYFDGPYDGRHEQVSRAEALFKIPLLIDTVTVFLLPDGAFEAVSIWEVDPHDERFDEGMKWLGYYVCDTTLMRMRWVPYASYELGKAP